MYTISCFSLIEVLVSLLLVSMFSLIFFQQPLQLRQMLHHTIERGATLNTSINESEHLFLNEASFIWQ